MAKSLEEKRREREAAKQAAESVKPPAPKAAPLAEPPAASAVVVAVAPETKRAVRPRPAEPCDAPPAVAPAVSPAAHRVAVPKDIHRAPPTNPKVSAPVTPARKAPPPMPVEAPAEEPVPASLAGLPDLSALEAIDTPTPAPAPAAVPAPVAVPDEAPPAPAPAPKEPPKLATKKIAFKDEGEGRRLGPVRIEYDGAAGPDAVKARVTAFGKEHEVVLPKSDSKRVSFQTPEGSEVSVALMFSGVNAEGDKEILADVGGVESGSTKAKQAAVKAVSKTGTFLSSVKKHALELVLGTYGVALATTVLAVTDLRVWMEQHMGAWRWPAAIGIPLVMVGLAVWAAVGHMKPEEQKTGDKKEA
ncbi:MAG TPA: hypothetical protein VLD37_06330 [Candidatus Bilamarchaeum sp.]|nr:hypothetical protein [Candidatus Bilamarchaeum sp.]